MAIYGAVYTNTVSHPAGMWFAFQQNNWLAMAQLVRTLKVALDRLQHYYSNIPSDGDIYTGRIPMLPQIQG